MNDEQRLQDLLGQLSDLSGLPASAYDRIVQELNAADQSLGYDEQGRLKVAMFDAKSYDLGAFQKQNQDRFTIDGYEVSLSPVTVPVAEGYKVICAFVNDQLDAGVIESLAKMGVELIAMRCAGYNNVDVPACGEHGISVVRVPAYSPHAVAEHTVALMLMHNRHLHQAYMRNRAGSFVLDGLTGFDKRGKTARVIGTGKIGECVAKILCGFECNVLCFDKYKNENVAALDLAQYVELEELLRESDIVTLHVPLMEATYHLINDETIAQMKRGVMFINTSRGGLVDTRALIQGLKSGQIGSAGLDVYEEEAGIFFHDLSDQVLSDDMLARLMTFNNVVITSHQAFLTHEALANIADTTLSNIEEYEQGKRGDELTNGVTA